MGSLQSGHVLKHYRITDKLGQGGMGEVYRAEDTKLNRYVAIKLLTASTVENETARRRLLQEARSAAALNHPSIVTVHAIDDHDGLDFIVMEYVEGETLKSVIERGGIPLAQLLDIGVQVADALSLGSRAQHNPPRHKERKHTAHFCGARQGARLRIGEEYSPARGRAGPRSPHPAGPDGRRHRARYCPLHVSRADARRAVRRADGPLLVGVRAVRSGDRQPCRSTARACCRSFTT